LKGVGFGTLLLIVILVAFPLAIASMVSGMEGAGSSGPGLPGNSTSAGSSGSTLADNLSQLGNSKIALILVIAIVFLAAPALFRSRTNILWELLTFAASVVAAVVAIVVVSGLTRIQSLGLDLHFGGGLYFIMAATLGLTAAGAALAVMLLLRRSHGIPVLDAPPPRPRRLRAGAASAGFSPYYGAADGGHRGVVISCYSAFCALLVKLGVGNPPSRTPREFASEAVEKTALDHERGRRITELFEKARYGREEVAESEAQESRDILDTVRGELGTGVDPGEGGVTGS
jgi:hypothetical protein